MHRGDSPTRDADYLVAIDGQSVTREKFFVSPRSGACRTREGARAGIRRGLSRSRRRFAAPRAPDQHDQSDMRDRIKQPAAALEREAGAETRAFDTAAGALEPQHGK